VLQRPRKTIDTGLVIARSLLVQMPIDQAKMESAHEMDLQYFYRGPDLPAISIANGTVGFQ
jgi:hypothetical protein